LPLGRRLQPLPRQRTPVKVHQHVAQRLDVIPPALFCVSITNKKDKKTNGNNLRRYN
jgi:hypothetical protein